MPGKVLKEVPCVVILTPSENENKEIFCGPFSTRSRAERFATALANGGCIKWATKVLIKEWNAE